MSSVATAFVLFDEADGRGPIPGDTEQHKWNHSRFAGVVSGIAHYRNCIGVPTIGGEG